MSYKVTRSDERKGKTHKVVGPGGETKYFGDPELKNKPNNPEAKASWYARHAKSLAANPHFRAYANSTWADGGMVADYTEDDTENMAQGGKLKKGDPDTYITEDGKETRRGLWANVHMKQEREKHKAKGYADGGEVQIEDTSAPLRINKEVNIQPDMAAPPMAPEGPSLLETGAKTALPMAAGAVGTAFGGPLGGIAASALTSMILPYLFADGGMVGSFASLTDAIAAKEKVSPFPEPTNETARNNMTPSVPVAKPQTFADGDIVEGPGLTPVAELPPVVEPAIEAPRRKPLEGDTESEGRAAELEAVLKEVGADKELDEGAKAYLRDQAFADSAKRGLPGSALRANYLSRKEGVATKMKAAAPANAPNEADKAPTSDAKASTDTSATQAPVAPPVAPTTGNDLRNKSVGSADSLGTGPLAVLKKEVEFSQEVGDKAYAQYQKTRAQVLSDLGGVNTSPQTPEDYAKNRELFSAADDIAKATARQYAALFAPAAEVTATKSADTTPVAPVAATTDTPAPVAAVATPVAAPAPVGKEVASGYLYNAAIRAGMKPDAATTFANEFSPRLQTLQENEVVAQANNLIQTDERAQAAIQAGSDLRRASVAKLAADVAIQEKSKALDDAAATLQGNLALDIQRRLSTAQMQADRLRREILDDTRAADKYLKGSSAGGISSLLGIIGAGLGSTQSYQDWYGKRVQEELKTQYDLMGKKQTLMGLYLDQTKNLDDAYKLTEASIKRVLAAQTQAKLGSLMDERAKQEAIMAAKKLELDATKTESEVINGVATRQHNIFADSIDKQRGDLNLAKEVLNTFQDDTIARINAAAAGVRANAAAAGASARAAERREEKAGPPSWGKALRGEKITDADIEEIGKWNDSKRSQIVPVTRPVKTTEKINGKDVDVYSLSPSPGLHTLARSEEGAKKINASDVNTANMMRAWNTMSRLGAKHNYSKVGLDSNGEDKAAYADAIQAIIAGYSELRNTGVISGGEYDRYKSQADNVDLTTRASVAASAFTSFNKTLADSNAAVRSNYLQKPSSGATSVDISAVPAGHIKFLKDNASDAAARRDFDAKYGKGAAAAVLGE